MNTDPLKIKGTRDLALYMLTVSIIIVSALFAAVYPLNTAGAAEGAQVGQDPAQRLQQYTAIEQKLKAYVFADGKLEQTVAQELVSSYGHNEDFIVFLSLCNAADRATVVSARGGTLDQAWENAGIKAKAFVESNAFDTVWLKADIVNYKKNKIP